MVFADLSESQCDNANEFGEDYLYHYLQSEPLTTSAFYDALAVKFKRHGQHLLDFGCGVGEFVSRAISAGIEAEGVDRAPYAALAREVRQLPIRANLAEVADGSFHVVFSHATFEHLYDARGIAELLLTKLRPRGLFVISGVPNYNAVERRLGSFNHNDPPGHVNYFSPKSIRELYWALGLTDVKVRTYGVPIWYFLNLLHRKGGGSGLQAFKFTRGYIPARREPSFAHRAFACLYAGLRIPGMGVALTATGIKPDVSRSQS